jgi:hypothetical protein
MGYVYSEGQQLKITSHFSSPDKCYSKKKTFGRCISIECRIEVKCAEFNLVLE